jgi:hypothetical protein
MRKPILDTSIQPLDTIVGVPNISRFTGLTERRVYDLLQKGKLPGRKFGGLWISGKQKLRATLGVDDEVA